MIRVSVKRNDDLFKRLFGLKNARGRVGWFEDSKYDDNTQVAQVAYWQEYGTSRGIPMRPFMRPAEAKHGKEWEKYLLTEIQICLNKGEPFINAMKRLGLKVKGDIQQAIIDVTEPPLKESTIKARLRRKKKKVVTASITKPLVDTGVMLASVGHKEEEI